MVLGLIHDAHVTTHPSTLYVRTSTTKPEPTSASSCNLCPSLEDSACPRDNLVVLVIAPRDNHIVDLHSGLASKRSGDGRKKGGPARKKFEQGEPWIENAV